MPSPEQIIKETVENISEKTDIKEQLDEINIAISRVNELENITEEEIKKVRLSIDKILYELTDTENYFLSGETYEADYDLLDSHGDPSVSDPYGELYLEYIALNLESYLLSQGRLDEYSEPINDTYEFLYESLDMIKQKREEYLELLEDLPETAVSCYPSPVRKGETLSVEINYSLIEEGVQKYREITSSFLGLSGVGIGSISVGKFSGSIDPTIGLPRIDLNGFQNNTTRTVNSLNEYNEAIFEGDNTLVEGTILLTSMSSHNQMIQAGFQGDLYGNTKIDLNIDNNLPAGIYIVQLPVYIGGRQIIKKIIVQ